VDDNPEHLGYECKKDCSKECEFGQLSTKACFASQTPLDKHIHKALPLVFENRSQV